MKAALLLACMFSGLINTPSAHEQAAKPARIPNIIIELPADIASEKVELRYFLVGSFGGYGDSVNKQPGVHSYMVPAGVNGSMATNAKIVAYAPGCAFMTWDIPIHDATDQKKTFTCAPLGILPLSGKIQTSKYYKGKNAMVEVLYVSNFSESFFHVADGMVTIFPVAQSRLEPNGTFQISMPDLLKDPAASVFKFDPSSFRFVLREPGTLNIIATLELKDSHYKNQSSLPLAASYPGTVSFAEESND